MIGFGWLFVVLGLAALVGGCWAMFAYVIPAPTPPSAARRSRWCRSCTSSGRLSSSLAAARQPAPMIQARVSAMIHNLPYS